MTPLKILTLAAATVLAISTTGAEARPSYSPAPGTPERTAVLNALRPSIEAELGPSVEFVVEEIRMKDGWALVHAAPQRKGGRKIDWRRYYSPSDWSVMDGLGVTAILRHSNGRWNLVDRVIGATDVWWCDRIPSGLSDVCDQESAHRR